MNRAMKIMTEEEARRERLTGLVVSVTGWLTLATVASILTFTWVVIASVLLGA